MKCINSITVTPSSITVKQGSWYYGLYATVCPTDAECKSVKWTSSNPSVASVNKSNGYVYGISAGTAVITATATDGCGASDSCTVTVVDRISVDSVTLDVSSVTLEKNDCTTLNATVCPSDATNKALIWTSSNESVATVDNGVVCAKENGTAVIKACTTDGSDLCDCCTVTVTGDVLVSSIVINTEVNSLVVGNSTYLSATVYPDNATNKYIEWSSSDASVLGINSTSGNMWAVGPGVATIYASATDGSGVCGCCTVTVLNDSIPVDSILLDVSSVTLEKNDCTTLNATVCPSNATNKALIWTSSNESVATVDNGVICAKENGTAVIKACTTDGSDLCDYCTVTVTGDVLVSSITITTAAAKMLSGKSAIFEATVYPINATNPCVRWSSSNSSVLQVNPYSGLVSAISEGNAIVYATATDGSGACGCCTVTVVNDSIPVDSILLDVSSVTLEKNDCTTLNATVCPSNATNKALIWTSSNESVATVDNGVVCAKENGTAVIKACTTDGSDLCDYCTVTVTGDVLVSSITITTAAAKMLSGKSAIFEATVYPINATNPCVRWSSSNSSVLQVNPYSGLVSAISEGNAIVYATATDGSGVVGEYEVRVYENIKVENIFINECSTALEVGDNIHLTATVCPSDATFQTVRWSSSSPVVAEIDETTGELIANLAGKATITATALGGDCIFATVDITVRQKLTKPIEKKPIIDVPGAIQADPINVGNGAHIITNTVMSLYGGQNNQIKLKYDSSKLMCGDFGCGWYHNYEKIVEISECEARVYNSPSEYSVYKPCSSCCSIYSCVTPGQNGNILTVTDDVKYPYVLNCNSDRTEYYDSNGRLGKIVDHNEFETVIEYSDNVIVVTDAVTNNKLYLEKDSACRIVKVYDNVSRLASFTYDGNLLVSITDPNNNTIRYTYDSEGKILTGTDSLNTKYFENTYDELDRIVLQKDAVGGMTTFAYCDDGTRTITDRNGKSSTHIFDKNGLLVSYTDANGNTITYEYDANFNVTKETDAKGNSTIKTYNSFNKPAQITDRNGNKTYFTYDEHGNVTNIHYPAINGVVPEETFAYNNRNQMTQHTDIRGTVTIYTYDSNGMPSSKKVGDKNAVAYSYEGGLLKYQTDAMGNTTRYTHNSIGQVCAITDADNKITQYTYDNCGNLLRTVDANGKSAVTVYDGNYQKTSVTDANGNTTSYHYNGNMKNDVITLPDGHTVRYEFDGEDRIIKVTDQDNNVTNITYDDAGRVLSKRFSDGALVQYEYDAVGNVIKETNPKGAVVTKTYDNLGNVLTITDDKGNLTRYQYNAMSKPTRVVNATAGTTVYQYSKAGDILSETDPFNNTKSYTYDDYGNRLTATDAKGNVTTYTYDANNNLLTVRDALGHVTTYTYNSLNQCISVKDALNNVIRYGYDALGRRTTITDARGNVFTTTYDGNGNVIKTTDARGNTISETVYSCLNQPLTVTDAMGKATTYTYNALGKVESVTDSMNHRTEFTYNSRGQNTAVRDASNNVSSAIYDLLGNVTRLAGPLGGATNYTYDDMGRLVTESTVSGGTKNYEYNELNIRRKITNARGQVRQVFCDVMGRITGYTSPEGAVSYTYDANSNVLTVNDSHGTITRTYDALNRVSSYTDTYGKVIRYEYDAVGNLYKIIYPDNTAVTYAYDANHNLIRVTDWANRVTTYTYDENNRVVGVTKPDGSVTTTVYDNKQRVTSTVERTASGVVITGFEYTYDDLSRIIEEKVLENSTKMCYTYDSLNRVTKRTTKDLNNNVLSEESFTYDAAGNITDAPDSCFMYDTNNRLTTFNGNSVSYDMDGNMLNNGESTFRYDSANRLVYADCHTYTYNAEDVRIRNLCTDEDTTYTYNTNAKLSMLLMKTTNGVVTKYVYGKGLIGEEVSGAFKTYHFDCRGSTIAVTDTSGNITDTFAYDTYGKLISRTGASDVIFGYNGRDGVVTDGNGLIYMRARYYSPDMKRFVNADIIPGEISNAVTLNRFAYANGNPVSFVDPFGLSVILGALLLGGLTVGALALSGCSKRGGEKASGNSASEESLNDRRMYTKEEARVLALSGIDVPADQIMDDNDYRNNLHNVFDDEEGSTSIPNPNKSQVFSSNHSTEFDYDEKYMEIMELQMQRDMLQMTGYATTFTYPAMEKYLSGSIINAPRPRNIGKGIYAAQQLNEINTLSKGFMAIDIGTTSIFTVINTIAGINLNHYNGEPTKEIVSDAILDMGGGAVSLTTTILLSKAGTAISPGWGTVIGFGAGLFYDLFLSPLIDSWI